MAPSSRIIVVADAIPSQRNWKEHPQDEPLKLLEKQWRERVVALDLVEELEFLMATGPDRLFDYSRG